MRSFHTRDVVTWIILGVIAGAIADAFVPGRGNLIGYLAAGILGAFVGGFLAQRLNIRLRLGSPFVEQMIVSVVGAIIVLVIARIVF